MKLDQYGPSKPQTNCRGPVGLNLSLLNTTGPIKSKLKGKNGGWGILHSRWTSPFGSQGGVPCWAYWTCPTRDSPTWEWTSPGPYRLRAELWWTGETSGMKQATAIIDKKAEASGVAGTPVPRGRIGEAKVPAKIPKNEFSQKTQTWYFCKFIAGTFASNAHCWKVWKFDFNNLNLKGGGGAQAY